MDSQTLNKELFKVRKNMKTYTELLKNDIPEFKSP